MKKDTITIYASKKVKGQFGWRYTAKNGRKLATSGELYKNRAHAARMVDKLFGCSTVLGRVDVIGAKSATTKPAKP
jgi:uncharacterized protein YegP (UPF0339 family)